MITSCVLTSWSFPADLQHHLGYKTRFHGHVGLSLGAPLFPMNNFPPTPAVLLAESYSGLSRREGRLPHKRRCTWARMPAAPHSLRGFLGSVYGCPSTACSGQVCLLLASGPSGRAHVPQGLCTSWSLCLDSVSPGACTACLLPHLSVWSLLKAPSSRETFPDHSFENYSPVSP